MATRFVFWKLTKALPFPGSPFSSFWHDHSPVDLFNLKSRKLTFCFSLPPISRHLPNFIISNSPSLKTLILDKLSSSITSDGDWFHGIDSALWHSKPLSHLEHDLLNSHSQNECSANESIFFALFCFTVNPEYFVCTKFLYPGNLQLFVCIKISYSRYSLRILWLASNFSYAFYFPSKAAADEIYENKMHTESSGFTVFPFLSFHAGFKFSPDQSQLSFCRATKDITEPMAEQDAKDQT